MDADLNRRFDYELRRLRKDRASYVKRLDLLKGFEGMPLKRAEHKTGKTYYYVKRQGSNKYVYLGTRACPDVKRICEAHFLKEAIRRIDSNISLIESFLKGFLPYDIYAVNEALPYSYRSETLPPVSEAYLKEGSRWKAKKLILQSEHPENYPEHKTEQTSDGVWVKTVSEVVLYERFKAAGFVQIYELPLVLDDYGPALYPDFTILSPSDMKTEIIVEYVGRLDLQKYRDEFAYKVGRYISNGYIPGVNLFFVFSDRDGHIDSMQINRVIEDIRGIQN